MNPQAKRTTQILGQLLRVTAITLGTSLAGVCVGVAAGVIYSQTLARVETPFLRPWGFTNEGEPWLWRHARESDLTDLPPGFIHYADTIDQLPLEEIGSVYIDLNGKAFAEAYDVEAIILPGRACSTASRWFTWGEHRKSFSCFQERWDLIWSDGPNGGGYFTGYDEESKRRSGLSERAAFATSHPRPTNDSPSQVVRPGTVALKAVGSRIKNCSTAAARYSTSNLTVARCGLCSSICPRQ